MKIHIINKGMLFMYLVLEGGPYSHKYRVEQFHFHWGQTSDIGAEHHIDGRTYAAEVRPKTTKGGKQNWWRHLLH